MIEEPREPSAGEVQAPKKIGMNLNQLFKPATADWSVRRRLAYAGRWPPLHFGATYPSALALAHGSAYTKAVKVHFLLSPVLQKQISLLAGWNYLV